jgi:hypothetical protein
MTLRGLRHFRSIDSLRPLSAVWPVPREPDNHFVVLLCRECLPFPDAGKEPTVSGAETPQGGFAKLTSRPEALGKSEEVTYEFCFHANRYSGMFPTLQ